VHRIIIVLVTLLSVLARTAPAQELRVEGESDHPAAVRTREVAERHQYLLLSRDTVLPADTRIAGDLVIVGAVVRMEGSVAGSVVVLPGGDFFLRPGGRVEGSAVAVRGMVLLSQRATVGEKLELPASVAARVEVQGTTYTLYLTPPALPPAFNSAGVFGFGIPTYDRVNGATLRLGGELRLYADSMAPRLSAAVMYHTARQRFGGEVTLTKRFAPHYRLTAQAARRPENNDAWIRGDLANSLAALFFRSDTRNYYQADEAMVEAAREVPASIGIGEGYLVPRVRLSVSRATSLPERDVWALFGKKPWRENPAIEPGRIVSGTLGAQAGWRGTTSGFMGSAALEWAPGGAGDFDFRELTVDGRWRMIGLWGHSLSVRGHLLHPLGSSAPPQRWSLLGGPGTLTTLKTGQLRGDHLVFVESIYSVPLLAIAVPVLGSPSVLARHAIGSAWTGGGPTPTFTQNIGAGLAFRFFVVEADIDPTAPRRPAYTAAVSISN
jgi:hypothetical protein